MVTLDIVTIAFNKPRLISEQIRLLRKHLTDDHRLVVIDNSNDRAQAQNIRELCERTNTPYVFCAGEKSEHHAALNFAWESVLEPSGSPYVGFLDHDIFPTAATSLIDRIEPVGFYGVGQRHGPTGRLYLWPGFCFFSRDWLAGRDLDFDGIRGREKKDDGDTGSMNWPLFQHSNWEDMYVNKHGYQPIREPDDYGLQSWGFEWVSDWVHFSNGSHWMVVPAPLERDRLLFNMLATL